MTRESRRFQFALVFSLGLHGVLTLLLLVVPGGGPSEPVQIYTVRIMEAPGRPQTRELTLSTQAISALKLDSPSLRTDTPPLPVPETPDIPSRELLPPTATEIPRADSSTTPPLADQTPAAIQPPSSIPPSTPPSPTRPASTATLPGLPQAPSATTPSTAVVPPGPPAPTREETAPLPPPDALPEKPTLLDRTRGRIRQLNLEVDTAIPSADLNRPQTPGTERNLLSLRLYSNRVREEVKKRFTFPGAFEPGLRTRVRVVLLRDGTVESTEIIEPSGNDRFDRLVCLAAITRAEIPDFPGNIEEDTLTLHFTCSP